MFHAALGLPERLAGGLSVDPLGAVGDGGMEAFGAEMLARSYFADASAAPPMPRVEFSQPAALGLFADLIARLPELEASLPSISVPFGAIVGSLSPMPQSAGTESAARIPAAWSHVEPGAGHFVWHEAPGSLVAALDRLVTGT